jgi:hypothetical protein
MRLFAALMIAARLLAAQEERVEHHSDGSVKTRYTVDAQGRRSGHFTEYHPDGKVAVKASYRADLLESSYESWHANGNRFVTATYLNGKLSGAYEERDSDGTTVWTAAWANGRLHGDAKVTKGTKVVITQKWKEGELTRLNRFAPHPRPAAALREEIGKILAMPPPPAAVKDDPRGPERYTALRRLQAYRNLCGLPWEDVFLDPMCNDFCDAAAEVCEKLGRIDHRPPDPGGLPEGRYQKGRMGALRSNLSVGVDMPGSVDGYMDDSDARNLEALGHRRWCLNPPLRRTGFGASGRYSAMWAHDASGSTPKGLKSYSYPPPGFVPVDFFGPDHAWSISFVAGPWPARIAPKATIEPLDEHYVPAGPPLETRAWVAPPGPGVSNCIAFLPKGLVVAPGRSYLVTLSLDKGATVNQQFVVEFIDPMGSEPR